MDLDATPALVAVALLDLSTRFPTPIPLRQPSSSSQTWRHSCPCQPTPAWAPHCAHPRSYSHRAHGRSSRCVSWLLRAWNPPALPSLHRNHPRWGPWILTWCFGGTMVDGRCLRQLASVEERWRNRQLQSRGGPIEPTARWRWTDPGGRMRWSRWCWTGRGRTCKDSNCRAMPRRRGCMGLLGLEQWIVELDSDCIRVRSLWSGGPVVLRWSKQQGLEIASIGETTGTDGA